ncbi:MAG: 30S ribosomal protein S19 [Candidatus Hadarchaeum yellowstonense]|jgi:small subunit ribosomal protein S19e|uniref:Small ribosomal subunit protein eS19 n=1 Tax=Hadarchaeum yellowstonense TaxID=1776334 RepID=A0A147JVS2_HADYE|nr:MAG: 30S ribosomal protein S19 [Candidatus Hadarchaeum yellowstonense]
MSVQEVQPTALIKRLSEELKKIEAIRPPQWALFVKTGVHKERPPEQTDWWYTRAASLLRRLYVDGPVGISRLRTYYGGRQNRGQPPEHFRKAGGKIIRVALQQLEKAGLVTRVERRGRKLTPKGVSMIESLARQMKSEKA